MAAMNSCLVLNKSIKSTLKTAHPRSAHPRPSRQCRTFVVGVRAQQGLTLEAAKENLIQVTSSTERGSRATASQRGLVEEAQNAVEQFNAGQELPWEKLEGFWRLLYTTASDVLPIVSPSAGLPGFPIQSQCVAQRFSSVEEGIVQNIIDVTLPLQTTARFVVEASWKVRTARSIALQFQSAGVEQVRLGADAQNILAPALLPRTWLNQQIILAIEELQFKIPITTRPIGSTSSTRQPVGLNYLLTYLDDDMLIGRAQGSGGTFIFKRDSSAS